jgi:hypothetical protein
MHDTSVPSAAKARLRAVLVTGRTVNAEIHSASRGSRRYVSRSDPNLLPDPSSLLISRRRSSPDETAALVSMDAEEGLALGVRRVAG